MNAIRKASNFHHLVKGLIRNGDINNKCKIDSYKVYFKKILLYFADLCVDTSEAELHKHTTIVLNADW
jgi:hypothetical protein